MKTTERLTEMNDEVNKTYELAKENEKIANQAKLEAWKMYIKTIIFFYGSTLLIVGGAGLIFYRFIIR